MAVHEHKIYEPDGKGVYTILRSPDFEFADPIQHFREVFIRSATSMWRDILLLKSPPVPFKFVEEYLQKRATLEWEEKLKEISATEVPERLLLLLNANKKNLQLLLLKNLEITPDQLIAFIFKAWSDFGFSFSQYTSEHHHKGLDVSDMPLLVEVTKEKVNKVGDTKLTDGQLKQAVNHRTVVVAKFFDSADSWHCFFLTYKSIRGEENWEDGQPHYHYISDKFGIPRDKVVEELKGGAYSLGNLPHIALKGYRDDEQKNVGK